MLASGVYGLVAILEPYDRMARDNFTIWGIHLAAFALPIIIGLILAVRFAKRL
jgi:hypothetical protein